MLASLASPFLISAWLPLGLLALAFLGPRRSDRIVAGVLGGLALVLASVPTAWVSAEALSSVREGYSLVNVQALHAPLRQGWIASLRDVGRTAAGDGVLHLLEQVWLVAVAAAGLASWARVRGVAPWGLAAVGWGLAASTLGVHLVLSASPGAYVAACVVAVWAGLAASQGASPARRGLGVLVVGAAVWAAAGERAELLALGLPVLAWVFARALAPRWTERWSVWWATRWPGGAVGVVGALVGTTVAAAVCVAVGVALLTTMGREEHLGRLGGSRAFVGALDVWAWLLELARLVGPGIVALVAVGLLAAWRHPGKAAVAVGWLVLGRLYFTSAHSGAWPYESLRYALILAGPTAWLALEGLAAIGPALTSTWRRAFVVAAVLAPPLRPAPFGGGPWHVMPLHTPQQEEVRFLHELVAAHPDCAFVAPAVDQTAALPDAAPSSELPYGTVWFGKPVGTALPVSGPDPVPEVLHRRGPVPCTLMYLGLDCALGGGDPCAEARAGTEVLASREVSGPPFNAHHGLRPSSATLELRTVPQRWSLGRIETEHDSQGGSTEAPPP